MKYQIVCLSGKFTISSEIILLVPYKVKTLIMANKISGSKIDLSILYFDIFFISITNKYNTLKVVNIQLSVKKVLKFLKI